MYCFAQRSRSVATLAASWQRGFVAATTLAGWILGAHVETAAAGGGELGWRVHAAAQGEPRHVPGRLLVKFRAPLGAAQKAQPALRTLLGAGLDTARPLVRRAAPAALAAGVERIYEIAVDPTRDIPTLAAKLSRMSAVEYAEPVYLYWTDAGGADASPRTSLENPDDPDYPALQRHLGIMQADSAWTFVKGEDGIPVPVVCIIDGGTNWQHEDLLANVWTNAGEIPANGIDDDGNGYVDDVHGWDFQADDGDPRGDFLLTPSNANHGTHTAGLAVAVTHNATGIAAPSWNAKLMSVNASGQTDQSIAHGYTGIVYAAENGADIVSLSWGNFFSSQAMQDVIDFAVSQGTCVMAASGNDGLNKPFFPAAYNNVYAVANVWGTDLNTALDDQRYGGSAPNVGGWVDVSAAGVHMLSTYDFQSTNAYGRSTGTSMSCPVAAGVAALIVAQNPGWGPLKVGEQLRMSCDNINALNPGFEDLLGRGRVNMLKAVTQVSPSVRIIDWTFSDPNGDGHLSQGESVTMALDLHNYLDDASNLALVLSTPSPWLAISDSMHALGALLEDSSAVSPAAFAFTVDADTPPGTAAELRVDMTAQGGYSDFQFIPLVLQPMVETHDVNSVRLSLTSTGGIGWIGFAASSGENGEGFSWQGGPNLLFEGALMLGTSAANLSDAARTTDVAHTDFAPFGNLAPTKSTPGTTGDQEIEVPFDDAPNLASPLNVRVDLRSVAFSALGSDDFVFLGYDIRNTSGADFNDLWVGLFFDWDIDADHAGSNRAAWDASRKLGYAWDNIEPSLPYVGVMALSGSQVGYSAIRNDGVGQPVRIYDDFSKSEKWNILDGGTGFTSAGPTDISNALSVGPYNVAANESISVWFALLAGADLADLQANADVAIALFGDSVATAVHDPPPVIDVIPRAQLRLEPAVPNPFNPGTRLRLAVDRVRDVRVGIYDARGRLVRLLLSGPTAPGVYEIFWNGRDDADRPMPSGVYFARMHSELRTQVQRVVLTK